MYYDRRIELSAKGINRKLVIERRGGICYELNGLLQWALFGLGFSAWLASGAAWHYKTGYQPDYDHGIVEVKLGEQLYLADMGFGEFSASAILIADGHLHEDERGCFRISQDKNYWLVNKQVDTDWKPAYRFTIKKCQLSDFAAMCLHFEISPRSPFRPLRMISKPLPQNTRLRLTNKSLEQIYVEKDTPLTDKTYFNEQLKQYFGFLMTDKPN